MKKSWKKTKTQRRSGNQKSCEQCTKLFIAASDHPEQRFCGRTCWGLSQRGARVPRIKQKCKQCQQVMLILPSYKTKKEYCSRACSRLHFNRIMSGPNNPVWIGGSNAYWKRKARERDNYSCQYPRCDVKNAPRIAHAHHKIPRSAGGPDALSNLITLCHRHHAATERLLLIALFKKFPKETAKLANSLYSF